MTENEDKWRSIFETGNPDLQGLRKNYNWLPWGPRCRLCSLPFRGPGGFFMRVFRHKGPSERNRHYCNACNSFIRATRGGAEVPMSILFVDIRNSSRLAEQLAPTPFAGIIRIFTRTVAEALTDDDGFIFKFGGDSVGTVYPPGFLGPVTYARRAIAGAEHLLRTAMPRAPDDREVSIGIGVDTGRTYIGTLGPEEQNGSYKESIYDDVQPLGDVPNVSARLSGEALPGQALISEATLIAAGYKPGGSRPIEMSVKGRSAPITVYAITRDTAPLGE